jgi:predicted RNA-binding Zn-ribbon protein involved in translation (DUF1610 family)
MSEAFAAHTVNCTQCGGELHPDEGQIFLTCPFCGSTVFLDKSQVVFHWYLAATLDEDQARGALARWMAGNETVKDLDQKSQVTGSSFEYFPLWYFKRRSLDDQEEIALTPAAAISVSEIRRLRLPAGDLRKYDDSIEHEARAPTIPLEAAMTWLERQNAPAKLMAERSLVHVPLYTFKYLYRSEPYTALVEGATGQVLANIYPVKEEAPYRTAGALAALVFLCLATFPVIGALANGAQGFGFGTLACTGAGLIAAPLLFALAAWVAQKI